MGATATEEVNPGRTKRELKHHMYRGSGAKVHSETEWMHTESFSIFSWFKKKKVMFRVTEFGRETEILCSCKNKLQYCS